MSIELEELNAAYEQEKERLRQEAVNKVKKDHLARLATKKAEELAAYKAKLAEDVKYLNPETGKFDTKYIKAGDTEIPWPLAQEQELGSFSPRTDLNPSIQAAKQAIASKFPEGLVKTFTPDIYAMKVMDKLQPERQVPQESLAQPQQIYVGGGEYEVPSKPEAVYVGAGQYDQVYPEPSGPNTSLANIQDWQNSGALKRKAEDELSDQDISEYLGEL